MSAQHDDADDDDRNWIECWQCAGVGMTPGCFEDCCSGADCDPDDAEMCCAPSRCDVCKGAGIININSYNVDNEGIADQEAIESPCL